jgi:hypothetical protein
MDDPGFDLKQKQEFFFFLQKVRTDLGGPPKILLKGYRIKRRTKQGSYPGEPTYKIR